MGTSRRGSGHLAPHAVTIPSLKTTTIEKEFDMDPVLKAKREYAATTRRELRRMRESTQGLSADAAGDSPGSQASRQALETALNDRVAALVDHPDRPIFFGRHSTRCSCGLWRGAAPAARPRFWGIWRTPPWATRSWEGVLSCLNLNGEVVELTLGVRVPGEVSPLPHDFYRPSHRRSPFRIRCAPEATRSA